jgi:hypothetical protein
MTPKVIGILRQRYAECKVASKVFKWSFPKNGIVWICHAGHIKSDVLCARVFRGAEGHRECNGSDRFNSFPAEAIKGLRRFFESFLVKTYFVEGC